MVKRNISVFPKVHPSQTQHTDTAAMQTEENMLRTEIEFWRYMIESRRGNASEQATERMLNACELAERKLMMVNDSTSIVDRQH
jgi:hypothetical protein